MSSSILFLERFTVKYDTCSMQSFTIDEFKVPRTATKVFKTGGLLVSFPKEKLRQTETKLELET